MARKANQPKNGVDRQTSKQKKKGSDSGGTPAETKANEKPSEVKVFPGEEISNGDQPISPLAAGVSNANHAGDENKSKQKSGKVLRKEKQGMDPMPGQGQSTSSGSDMGNCNGYNEAPSVREHNGPLPHSEIRRKHAKRKSGYLLNRHVKNLLGKIESSDSVLVRNLRTSTLSLLKVANEWFQRHKPMILSITSKVQIGRDYVKTKVDQAYPVVRKWLMQLGSVLLIISMLWLDFTLRGLDSFVRMGTTSLFSVIWFSILSVISMVGMFKFLIFLVSPNIANLLPTVDYLIIRKSLCLFTDLCWVFPSFWVF